MADIDVAFGDGSKPENHAAVSGELIAIGRYPDLGTDWRALQECADGSPFVAWAWVSTWLRHLPATCRPNVFRARDAHGLLALGLLLTVPERGLRRIFGNHSILLQETGDTDIDEVTIEYAGLLVRRGCEVQAYAALFDSLKAADPRWRSLRISASTHAPAVIDALPRQFDAFSAHSQTSHLLDLAAVRRAGGDYVAHLGSRTRSGLRRTRRAYEALGELRVDAAADGTQALTWLDELRVLHERYWHGKGQRGSFASAFFVDFHRDLLRNGTMEGFTQLLRVSAGDEVIGYLYNIVWRKRVYFYNAGLNYGVLPREDRPGYLAQWLAIEKCLADGMDIYDFMAGDQQYKRMLATSTQSLQWIDVRPRTWRGACERVLLSLLRRPGLGTPLAAESRETPATSA